MRSKAAPASAGRARLLLAALCGLASVGCPTTTELLARVDAGPEEVLPWGRFAAALPVPQCTWPETIVVDTTDEGEDAPITDLAQAGPTVSLVEALRLAEARDAGTTIRFSEAVFPAETPATIHLTQAHAFRSLVRTCIDGRDRGVVVDWDPGLHEANCALCGWTVSSQSLVVGLTLGHAPTNLRVTGDGQIAGLRFAPGGGTAAVELWRGVAGPGNVFGNDPGQTRAVAAFTVNGPGGVIRDNFIGYDPRRRLGLPLQLAMWIFHPVDVERNVFGSVAQLFQEALGRDAGVVTVRDNFIGVDPDGGPIDAPRSLGVFIGGGRTVFGPGNVVRGVGSSMLAAGAGPLQLTQNSITQVTEWNLWALSAQPAVEPPTLTRFTSGAIYGTCPVSGSVELFADPGALGETYLYTMQCNAGAEWGLGYDFPPQRNITATLTDARGWTSNFSAPMPVPP